jgi:hypothetical protein
MSKDKLVSLAKGAGVAAIGAALTYVSQWASGQDFGSLAPLVTALLAVVTNAVRLKLQSR